MAMALTALVTEVQSRVKRTDINTNIQNTILKLITRLETKMYWPWRMTRDASTVILASGTYEYDLPSDFGEDFALRIIDDDKEADLERIAWSVFVHKHPDPSSKSGGQPTEYTIGVKEGTAGTKRIHFPHPADAEYTAELIYFNRRADATATDFPDGFTELEKLYLTAKASAIVKKQILGYSNCDGSQTCECDGCEARQVEGDMLGRYSLERKRGKVGWQHKESRPGGGFWDIRGNQDIYRT